jgi:hypothetical protein
MKIKIHPLKIKIKNKRRFCGRKCYGIYNSVRQSGKNNPGWRGGVTFDMTAYKKEYYKKHPDRYRAGHDVAYAVRKGVLMAKPCTVCGSEKTEAHHEDYSKTLDVIWLCALHHQRIHHKRRKEAVCSA